MERKIIINKIFWICRFEAPVVMARGGRKMTKKFAFEILKDMESKIPRPQINIFVMGDCNLRWFYDSPEDLYNMYGSFLLAAAQVPNCRLILSTLVPSIENYK